LRATMLSMNTLHSEQVKYILYTLLCVCLCVCECVMVLCVMVCVMVCDGVCIFFFLRADFSFTRHKTLGTFSFLRQKTFGTFLFCVDARTFFFGFFLAKTFGRFVRDEKTARHRDKGCAEKGSAESSPGVNPKGDRTPRGMYTQTRFC
jgi:hypothetical protein